MDGRSRGRGRSRGFNRGGRFSGFDVRGGNRCRGRNDNNWREPSGSRNASDDSGRISKSFICKSVFHWDKDCPNQSESRHYESDNVYDEEVHVTLLAKGMEPKYQGQFFGDTIGCAVLDYGCSRNVCSDKWLDCFIE